MPHGRDEGMTLDVQALWQESNDVLVMVDNPGRNAALHNLTEYARFLHVPAFTQRYESA